MSQHLSDPPIDNAKITFQIGRENPIKATIFLCNLATKAGVAIQRADEGVLYSDKHNALSWNGAKCEYIISQSYSGRRQNVIIIYHDDQITQILDKARKVYPESSLGYSEYHENYQEALKEHKTILSNYFLNPGSAVLRSLGVNKRGLLPIICADEQAFRTACFKAIRENKHLELKPSGELFEIDSKGVSFPVDSRRVPLQILLGESTVDHLTLNMIAHMLGSVTSSRELLKAAAKDPDRRKILESARKNLSAALKL